MQDRDSSTDVLQSYWDKNGTPRLPSLPNSSTSSVPATPSTASIALTVPSSRSSSRATRNSNPVKTHREQRQLAYYKSTPRWTKVLVRAKLYNRCYIAVVQAFLPIDKSMDQAMECVNEAIAKHLASHPELPLEAGKYFAQSHTLN